MTSAELLALPSRAAIQWLLQLGQPIEDRWLPFLVRIAIEEKGSVSVVAGGLLDAVVEDPSRLGTSARNSYLSHWSGSDRVKAIQALRRSDSFGLAVTCSYVYDGYIREAGVVKLAGVHGERALPYLMLRVSDHIAPVREKAMQSALSQIPQASDGSILAAFNAFQFLHERSGPASRTVAEAYRNELLARPGLLRSIRKKVDDRQYRWLFDNHMIAVGEDWLGLIGEGLAETSPPRVVRVARLVQKLPDNHQLSLLDDLSRSPVPFARTIAVEVAHKHDREDILEVAMVDANWRVRNDARFYLSKRGVGGFTEEYRHLFPSSRAVAGFGEVASYSELHELIPLVDHSVTSTRRAAITALGKGEVRDAAEVIERRLADRFPSVVRAARKALLRLGVPADAAFVEALVKDLAGPANLRRATEKALDLVPRWPRLLAILRLSQTGALLSPPKELILAWLRRSPRDVKRPSAQELVEIIDELVKATPFLDPRVVEQVRIELNHWRSRR